MPRRIERVNDLLRQEISRVLTAELRDPRIAQLVSVTRVEVSLNLRYCKVYVSVMGDDAQKESTLAGLESAAGFVHRALRRSLDLRTVPTLDFRLDESIARGGHVLDLLRKVSSEGPPQPHEPR